METPKKYTVNPETGRIIVEGVGEIPLTEEKLKELVQDDRITAEAGRTPFPGALRDAFKIGTEIEVGKYKVRPFFDGDIDVLLTLDHPLAKMAFGEDGWGELKTTRGQMAWDLCWVMTQPVQNVSNMLDQDDAIANIRRASKAEFSKYQLGDLVLIQKAIFTQFTRYLSPVIGFEAADENGQKKTQ